MPSVAAGHASQPASLISASDHAIAEEKIVGHANESIGQMLTEACQNVLGQIDELMRELGARVTAVFERVSENLRRLYSAYWEREHADTQPNSANAREIRAVRDRATLALAPKRQQLDEMISRATASSAGSSSD